MKLMLVNYIFMPLLAIAGMHALGKVPDGPCADMRAAACHRFLDAHNSKVRP